MFIIVVVVAVYFVPDAVYIDAFSTFSFAFSFVYTYMYCFYCTVIALVVSPLLCLISALTSPSAIGSLWSPD